MVRKFLYIIAFLISLTIAGALVYRLFPLSIMRAAMVPSATFEAPAPAKSDAYVSASMWIARPDIVGNPSLWLPPSVAPQATRVSAGKAATFFIHPTSYLSRTAWNAPLDDQDANDRAALFVRGQASVFNAASDVWAPRYRQATFGAFLTDEAAAAQALDAAYGDVLAAFDSFVAGIAQDRPIILAGHSQGALHLMRLLKERVAGKPLSKRIVAAYVIGWPVSLTADLPALGLPACAKPEESGCILSWQSFAEPAEPDAILSVFDATTGLTGAPRRGSAMLCTNPLTSTPKNAAPASANLGTTIPSANFKTATYVKGAVPARCAGRGFLLIGDAPKMGPYVLPGNNYHVYDYSLFWANIRGDVERRARAFAER